MLHMLLVDFSQWLRNEIARQGLSQADIARRADISPSQVSRIINATSTPSQDALSAIARALRLPPDEIYRQAGLLPPIPNNDAEIAELDHIARQLNNDNKYELVRFARMKLQIQEEGGKFHADDNHLAGEAAK